MHAQADRIRFNPLKQMREWAQAARREGVDSAEDSSSFLPDFFAPRVVFLVVLSAELLAFILALASRAPRAQLWLDLALVSLFIQWIALGNVVALGLSRRWLERYDPLFAGLGCYGLSLVVTLVVSVVALWLAPAGIAGLGEDLRLGGDFVLRNVAISAIVSAVALRYFYVQNQWKRNIETEARARIQALQARMRPHFLFNSMNTIASLTRSRPDLAERAVEDLADLFRASLGHKEKVSLEEELEFTRRYINIEQLRLGERLQIDWQLDDELDVTIGLPALILQPLVENAIYHGIEPQTSGGVVTLAIREQGDALLFSVTNPVAPARAYQQRSGNKMAHDNIRQRLRLAYADKASMRIDKNEHLYTVKVSIPVEHS